MNQFRFLFNYPGLAALGNAGLLLLAASENSAIAASSVRIAEPRCEYLINPMGLDVARPRLSWKLEARTDRQRGQRQTAYQVFVATSPKLLTQGKADLWDSSVVYSSQSVNVVYSGHPLSSRQACYWTVRVCDEKGQWSDWSEPARWTMGLVWPNDWRAQWIGTDASFIKGKGWPPPDNTIPDPWFRKTFDLPEKPEQAVMTIASIGYHELYVNGQKVGDAILVPNATDHKHRSRYVTYDITKHLRKGKNAFGLWLGLSWSIFPHYKTEDKPTSPIVLAQADLTLSGGKALQVCTDATWKTHPSPNTLLGVWDFMHFGGELYDANRELPNWCAPDLDDSAWQAVKLFKPNLRLSADKAEPNRLIKQLKPVDIREVTNGVYRVDMGLNYAGWFELDIHGNPGDRVQLQFSERENEAMTHRLHSGYILGPSGKGTFRNRFNYSVGRWVQITGLRAKPAPSQIRGWLVRSDYGRAAEFQCDDELLNRIYKTTLWTFENLSLGSYVVDCPQRERMGYGGDAHATTRPGLNNYSLGAFYTKWIEDWRDVQGPDGNLPYTAPTYWGGGGPGCSGYCITLPWEMYRRYGDLRILAENWRMMERWLAFLETKAENDMLKRWGGEWDFLGDWLWPGAKGVNGDTRETLFFNNCYWLYNLQTAAKIADALGNLDAASKYRSRADTVKRAVHSTFFNGADHSYVNGFPAYLAIALLVELPPAELRPTVWQRLETEILLNRKGHIHAGITGGAFLFQTLLENGRDDLIYEMASQEDYPGWGDMLKRGATTFHEDWESNLSYLHSSYLYIGSWFIEGLGGIRHPKAGFGEFEVSPWIDPVKGPRKVEAHYESPYGRIDVEWEIEDNRLELETTVPPNTTAHLRLPAIGIASLRENGKPLDVAAGITLVKSHSGGTALRLEPGSYRFEGLFTVNK